MDFLKYFLNYAFFHPLVISGNGVVKGGAFGDWYCFWIDMELSINILLVLFIPDLSKFFKYMVVFFNDVLYFSLFTNFFSWVDVLYSSSSILVFAFGPVNPPCDYIFSVPGSIDVSLMSRGGVLIFFVTTMNVVGFPHVLLQTTFLNVPFAIKGVTACRA